LLVFLAYLSLAIIFFWPLLLHINTAILQPPYSHSSFEIGGRDAYHFIWNFWWIRISLSSGQDPLYTHLFFYPQGTSLALQTIDFVDAFIAAPIAVLIGNLAAYNFVLFFSFVLVAFTTFLLAKHLTQSYSASFIAGLILAYAPQRFNQAVAGHPNLTSIEWLPLLVLCLLLMEERLKLRYAILSGIMLSLLIYTDPELGIMGSIMIVLYACYWMITNKFRNFRFFITSLSVMFFVAAGLTAPYLIPAYQSLGVVHAAPQLSQALINAAKPAYYLIPPPVNFAEGKLFSSLYGPSVLTGGFAQWVIFIGYSTLTLGAIGAIASKDRRRMIFLATAAVAFIFSLGPSSKPSLLSVRSPYTFLYNHLSIIQYFRAEARFSILLMFGLAILAAYAVQALMNLIAEMKGLSTLYAKILAIILMSLILLEFAPVVTISTAPSDPIYGIIAKDHSQFAVLEIPITTGVAQRALYEQTIYNKPLVNGKISQALAAYPAYVQYQIYLCLLTRRPCSTNGGIISQSYNQTTLAPVILSHYGIKYIIVHKDEIGKTELARITYILQQSLGSPIYQDRTVIAYSLREFLTNKSITQMASSGPLAFFGSGWIKAAGMQANNSAQLIVYVQQPGVYSLNIHSSTIPICVVNSRVSQPADCGSYDPTTGISTYNMFLNAGENILVFRIREMSATITSIQIVSTG
jgi:hypothetical protein